MLSVDIAVILSCARTRAIMIAILGDNEFLDLKQLDPKVRDLLLTITLHERIINEAEKFISDMINEFDEERKNKMYA